MSSKKDRINDRFFKNMIWQKGKLIFVIIFTLLLLAPFLTKPIYIDEAIIAYSARQILKHPLSPFSVSSIDWVGAPHNIRLLSNPPLIHYYVASIIKILKENELWLHIFFLPFPIITIISMYFLSKRFTAMPLISTLMLVSTPAFIVSATNIAPDVALLAFYLAGICLFIYGLDSGNRVLLTGAGLISGLACLTKYTGLTIIPLLLLYAILKRKISKSMLTLSFCFIILGIWCLHNIIFFRKLHFIEVFCWFKPTFLSAISNLLGNFTYVGATTIPFFFFILLIRTKKDLYIFSFIIWTVLLILNHFLHEYAALNIFLAAFFISLAALSYKKSLGLLKNNSENKKDIIFLLIWLLTISCYNIFVMTWFAAARYTLILTPPLIFLFLKSLSSMYKIKKNYIFIIHTGIALNFMLSILIARADCIYAHVSPNLVKGYTKYIKDKPVWFYGVWELQYYVEKSGLRYYSKRGDMPKYGDIIIMPRISDHEAFAAEFKKRLRYLGEIKYETPYPVRTFSERDKISFYNYAIGWLPYGISQEPLEEFQILQVE